MEKDKINAEITPSDWGLQTGLQFRGDVVKGGQLLTASVLILVLQVQSEYNL